MFNGKLLKVKSAEDDGALGVILFSDPKDFAPEGRSSVYPNTTRLPGMAVQSGSVLLGYGDPLTPLYPALGINSQQLLVVWKIITDCFGVIRGRV